MKKKNLRPLTEIQKFNQKGGFIDNIYKLEGA